VQASTNTKHQNNKTQECHRAIAGDNNQPAEDNNNTNNNNTKNNPSIEQCTKLVVQFYAKANNQSFCGSNSAGRLAWQLAPTRANRAGDTPTQHRSWHPLIDSCHGHSYSLLLALLFISDNNNNNHNTRQQPNIGDCTKTTTMGIYHWSIQTTSHIAGAIGLIVDSVQFYVKLSLEGMIYGSGSWHPLLLGMGVDMHSVKSCRGYSYSAWELKKLTTHRIAFHYFRYFHFAR